MYGIFKKLATDVIVSMVVVVLLAVHSASLTSTPGTQTTPATVLSSYDECTTETGCKCIDLEDVIGIMCNNTTEYDKLRQRLKNVFGSNTSNNYEITLTGIRTIPSYVVQGLNIFRLILEDSPLEIIPDETLNGVLEMRWFRIDTSSVRKVPNLRLVAHTLQHLNLDHSLLTSIGNEVQNMSLLEELTFRNNSIRSINADAFRGLPKVQTLDLSRNLLTFLPTHLLDGLESLRMLCLSHNQLVTMKGVLTVVRPRYILLESNNLTDVDEIFPATMAEVETVQLSNNPLPNVSESTLNVRLPYARFILLDHCLLRKFRFEKLTNLYNVSILDLSSNLIEEVVKEKINFGSDLQLNLDDNRISSFHGEIMYTTRSIYMSGNQMRRLGSTLTLRQLAIFEIKNNQLEAISAEELRGMHGTTTMVFQNNVISWIDRNAFLPLRNDLLHLDLGDNRLTSLNGSISFLSRLAFLNISHNDITFINKDDFIGLNELVELFMQNNKMTVLGSFLNAAPQLKFLTIQYNRLQTLIPQQLPKQTLRFLYYKGNPITCNCMILSLLEWLEETGSPGTDVTYCLSEDDRTNSWNSNVSTTISSSYPRRCPQRCQCFCNQADNYSLSVNCSARDIMNPPGLFRNHPRAFIKNKRVPIKILQSDSYKNPWNSVAIFQNADSRYMIADHMSSVNLEANRITSLDNWTFPRDLRDLRLAGNRLNRLPSSLMSLPFLKSISLSGNSWSCVCTAVGFKKWLLSKMDVVVDVNDTRCAPNRKSPNLNNHLLVNLSDIDLCPVAIAVYVTIGFAVLTLLLIVAALKILYIRYELNVKVWLYAHGITWVKENDLDQDKIFDAFIAYGHGDAALVENTIIPEIESRLPDVRLCFHERNFMPGTYIATNIMNAVKSSKRTVLMLSKAFFKSDWCLLEFRTAHQQAMEDKIQRVIVVKLGELPDEIDEDIKAYLDTVTYITWNEYYFWDKLLYSLPSPTKKDKAHFCGPTSSTESLL